MPEGGRGRRGAPRVRKARPVLPSRGARPRARSRCRSHRRRCASACATSTAHVARWSPAASARRPRSGPGPSSTGGATHSTRWSRWSTRGSAGCSRPTPGSTRPPARGSPRSTRSWGPGRLGPPVSGRWSNPGAPLARWWSPVPGCSASTPPRDCSQQRGLAVSGPLVTERVVLAEAVEAARAGPVGRPEATAPGAVRGGHPRPVRRIFSGGAGPDPQGPDSHGPVEVRPRSSVRC